MTDLITSTPVAILLAASGVTVLGRSVVLALRRRSTLRGGRRGPVGSWMLVRSIRAALVGSALVALGAGLAYGIDWLVALALIIGGQELLETSVMSMALRDEVARRETA